VSVGLGDAEQAVLGCGVLRGTGTTAHDDGGADVHDGAAEAAGPLPENDLVERITPASFPAQRGPNAKISLDELRPELERIRLQGWALQDEELAYGLRSVAAPVRGANGHVLAGVNIAVQAQDWSTDRLLQELKPAFLATCRAITELLII
jgi:DNA-binding IclR family transcriptional regulator